MFCSIFRGTSCKINRRTKAEAQLSDPVRAWLFQIITIVAVVSLGWYLFNNTQTNLTPGHHLGLRLSRAQCRLRHRAAPDRLHRIGQLRPGVVIGLLNTLLVTFIGVILATLLGFIIGVARCRRTG
jgi:general L-amino acid transport system permease protein